jgi:hypothetical protein
MCQSLQTKQGQEWIPDFLKDTSGTSVSIPKREQRNRNAIDEPLRADDVDEFSIQRRREQLRKQYDENPGSIKPNPKLSRKDIMREIT